MMKKSIFLVTHLFIFFGVYAQNVAINNAGTAAHTSAMLDVSSTDKGMLVPRMSSAEKAAIANPAQGLLVFDVSTNSFWYYAGGWREISSGSAAMQGAAAGDLTGSFPAPYVAGLLGRTIDPVAPSHLQVLKWNNTDNRWQPRADSLALPYSASQGYGGHLFGITNSAPSAGSSVIHGKSSAAGSGIAPAFTMGVWGDNNSGAGLVGTSDAGIGSYGFSKQNHGVYGYTTSNLFAGVYGSHAGNGPGVLGETEGTGTGILGRSHGIAGRAGSFAHTHSANTTSALEVLHVGLGQAASFSATNNSSTLPTVKIANATKGDGLLVDIFAAGTANAAVKAIHQGSGTGVHGVSGTGIAGRFDISNAASTMPALLASSAGTGSVLYLASNNTGNSGPAAEIISQGSGNGLNVLTNKGTAANFTVADGATTNDALTVSNAGDGIGVTVQQLKSTTNTTAIQVAHAGLGRGLNINLDNAANSAAGLNVTSAGQRGITADVAGQFAIYGFAAANAGMGVHGRANGVGAIGVKGTSGLGSVQNGTGVFGESGGNDAGGIGVKGVNYSPNETAGAVTGINLSNGVGVYGESTGLDGIGILGVAGQGGAANRAAQFKNINASGTKNVVEIINAGNGTNLYLNNSKAVNSTALFRGVYAGTGNFITLESNLGNIKTRIASTGDITTDGTITVKENKGIVRSSSSAQLRVETVEAVFTSAAGETLQHNMSKEISVSFSTPFSSPPVVYVGNMLQDGNASFMTLTVHSVTATGCKLKIRNTNGQTITLYTTRWNLVAMGAE